MPTEEDRQLYANCMELIKLMTIAINDILEKKFTTTFPKTNMEFLYLQFRFVFELIALASLCGHRKEYQRVEAKFHKRYEAPRILKGLANVNPEFFPVAHTIKRTPGERDEWVHLTDGVLTREELEYALGICGDNLHASNPYKEHSESPLEEEITRFRE